MIEQVTQLKLISLLLYQSINYLTTIILKTNIAALNDPLHVTASAVNLFNTTEFTLLILMQIELQLSLQKSRVLSRTSARERAEESQGAQMQEKVGFLGLFRFSSFSDVILMGIGSACSVGMGAAVPIFAYLTGNMIDSFGKEQNVMDEAKRVLWYYLYLGAASLVVGTTMYATWTIAGERQAFRCRTAYFTALMHQEMSWFDTQQQQNISTTFTLDSLSFQVAIGDKISTLIMLASMLFAGIGISLYLGWILALVILAYLPLLIVCWSKNMAIKRAVFQDQDQIYLESDRRASESLGAIKLVKQMNAEDFQSQNNKNTLQTVKDKYLANGLKYTFGAFIAILALYLGFALSFWYGSECVFGSEKCPQAISTQPYTAGSVIKIFYALLLPAFSLNQLTPSIQKIFQGLEAATRIFAIIDREPLIKSRENSVIPDNFAGKFRFENVSFAYPKDKSAKILRGFSFEIDCRHLAIVGRSGCGKSTILQLLMRFYDPDEGAIFLDGVDLRDLDLDWLRSQISYVGQEPVLFAASIRENLLLVKPDASDQDLELALRKAKASEFVNQLSQKLQTFVGGGGSQLSGGQKQRIGIARALLKGSQVLLLDEATSALDRTNERKILEALREVEKDFIIINITHRKRVLGHCDKILYIENGQVKRVTSSNDHKPKDHLLCVPSETGIAHHFNDLNTPSSPGYSFFSKSERAIEKSGERSINEADTIKKLPSEEPHMISEPQQEKIEANFCRLIPFLAEKLFVFVVGFLLVLIQGFTFPTIGALLSRIIIALLKYRLDEDHYRNEAYLYCKIALGISFCGALTNSICHQMFAIMGQKTVRQLRIQAFEKIVRMPVVWFEKEQNQHEKIMTSLTSSCKTLYGFIELYIPNFGLIAVNIVYCMVGALVFEWRTGLTAMGLIPLMVLAQAIQLGFIQGFSEFKGKIYSDSAQIISESVMNIRTVLSLGPVTTVVHRYELRLTDIFQLLLRKCLLSGFMFGLSYFLQYLSFALIFFLATVFISAYDLGIEGPLSSIFLVIFACISAGNKANLMQDIAAARLAVKTIFQLVDLEDQHQLRRKMGSKQLKEFIRGNIEFRAVSFKYESREEHVLRNFSLQIREGETVGLIGASGCGKSTIIGLLLGFYEPSQGEILLEGVDIRDFDLHHLRGSFGLVSQEPMLFNESIAWNIRYNLADASEEDVIGAARDANFDLDREQVVQLQPGLDTSEKFLQSSHKVEVDKNEVKGSLNWKVGPKGSHVSGGQKQRIAIARTIIRRPTVLLLDEVTSALDAENEAKVQGSLDRIMKGKTVISITHRLDSTESLDNLVVISNGAVVEYGNCRQLLQRGGTFAKLYRGSQTL